MNTEKFRRKIIMFAKNNAYWCFDKQRKSLNQNCEINQNHWIVFFFWILVQIWKKKKINAWVDFSLEWFYRMQNKGDWSALYVLWWLTVTVNQWIFWVRHCDRISIKLKESLNTKITKNYINTKTPINIEYYWKCRETNAIII